MPSVEVILSENINGLGAEADLVKVKGGFANNYLVPNGKAYYATPDNLKRLNKLQVKRAEREAKEFSEAQAVARKINKLKVTMMLETGETGKAFGSITSQDIVNKISDALNDVEIDHHKVDLDRAIKTTGTHKVAIKLHPEIDANLTLNVRSTNEEAEAAEESA